MTKSDLRLLASVLKSPAAPYAICSAGWLAAWWLSQKMSFLEVAVGASLIFLPAGVRTVSVLVYGARGACGVLIGSFITAQAYFSGPRSVSQAALILICAISAFSAYAAMRLVCWWRRIPNDLADLTMRDIFYLVLSQGLLSATLHQAIFYAENVSAGQPRAIASAAGNWLVMLVGDITGSLLFLGVFSAIAAVLHRWMSHRLAVGQHSERQ